MSIEVKITHTVVPQPINASVSPTPGRRDLIVHVEDARESPNMAPIAVVRIKPGETSIFNIKSGLTLSAFQDGISETADMPK